MSEAPTAKGLEGLTVLELGDSVAAAFCGKLLAGFGAQVLRLSRADQSTPFTAEEHAWLNTGKRWGVLDETQAGSQLQALIAQADIVLDAWTPGTLAALSGQALPALCAAHPQLILCQIAPFGQDGPRAHWQSSAITLYAASGLMHCTGDGAREPLNAGFHLVETTGGLNAYIACLMALLRRARDGIGECIDLSLQESAMENGEVALMEYAATGKLARRAADNHAMVPWRAYPCADGEATIIGGPIRNWLRAAQMFDEPELTGPKYENMGQRMANRAAVESLMRPFLQKHGKRELFHRGQAAGLAWSYLASVGEALADPQYRERHFFIDQPDAALGHCHLPDAPFRGSQLRWQTRPAPMPEPVGAALAASLGAGKQAPSGGQVRAANSSERAAPLQGVRVLDLTHDWAGPHCCRVLADYGAEVLKIEYHKRLDGMRGGFPGKVNEHARFWQLHRNKGSAALDLRDPEHRQVFAELVKQADLVVENSRPGVMDRLGFGYEALRALKPDIILLSMSAFGVSGPYAAYAGYGGTLEALCGVQDLTAYSPQDRRMRVREMDVTNGIFGSCAALTALWQRQQTGQGQWLDLGESETAAYLMGEFFIREARAAGSVQPRGNRDAQHAPQGCYRAAGEDRYLALSVRSDAQWQTLAALIGGETLKARYAQDADRQRHHDALDALLADWIATQDAAALAERLQQAGIAASLVCNAADLAADPQLAARGWWQTLDGQRYPGFPFRLAGGGAALRSRGPDLGQANAELFARLSLNPPDLSPEQLGTAYSLY